MDQGLVQFLQLSSLSTSGLRRAGLGSIGSLLVATHGQGLVFHSAQNTTRRRNKGAGSTETRFCNTPSSSFFQSGCSHRFALGSQLRFSGGPLSIREQENWLECNNLSTTVESLLQPAASCRAGWLRLASRCITRDGTGDSIHLGDSSTQEREHWHNCNMGHFSTRERETWSIGNTLFLAVTTLRQLRHRARLSNESSLLVALLGLEQVFHSEWKTSRHRNRNGRAGTTAA